MPPKVRCLKSVRPLPPPPSCDGLRSGRGRGKVDGTSLFWRPHTAVFRSGRGHGKVDGTSLVWRRPHTTVFLLNDATMGKFLDLTIFQKAGSWIRSCLGTIWSFGSDFWYFKSIAWLKKPSHTRPVYWQVCRLERDDTMIFSEGTRDLDEILQLCSDQN